MQNAAHSELAQLRQVWSSIPPEVNMPKDLPLAEELITQVAAILGQIKSSSSETANVEDVAEALRPGNAGILWDSLSQSTRGLYFAVEATLDAISVKAPESEIISKALKAGRRGIMHLSELMQQPLSGTVQRSS